MQHGGILPKRIVKIRHAGYLTHQEKYDRITTLDKQLKILLPMTNVKLPILTFIVPTWQGFIGRAAQVFYTANCCVAGSSKGSSENS